MIGNVLVSNALMRSGMRFHLGGGRGVFKRDEMRGEGGEEGKGGDEGDGGEAGRTRRGRTMKRREIATFPHKCTLSDIR